MLVMKAKPSLLSMYNTVRQLIKKYYPAPSVDRVLDIQEEKLKNYYQKVGEIGKSKNVLNKKNSAEQMVEYLYSNNVAIIGDIAMQKDNIVNLWDFNIYDKYNEEDYLDTFNKKHVYNNFRYALSQFEQCKLFLKAFTDSGFIQISQNPFYEGDISYNLSNVKDKVLQRLKPSLSKYNINLYTYINFYIDIDKYGKTLKKQDNLRDFYFKNLLVVLNNTRPLVKQKTEIDLLIKQLEKENIDDIFSMNHLVEKYKKQFTEIKLDFFEIALILSGGHEKITNLQLFPLPIKNAPVHLQPKLVEIYKEALIYSILELKKLK